MAQTSTATVSRVLSNKPGVTEEKRQRILQIAQRVGYSPNRIAKNLSLKKSHVFGFIAADIRNMAYVEFFHRIQALAREIGYQVHIADSEQDVEKERVNIGLMREHRAEGLIVFPVHDWHTGSDLDHFLQLKLQRFPFVLVGRAEGYGFDSVVSEEIPTAMELTRHLLGLGHRRIGFLGAEDDNRCIAERVEGTRRALSEAGLELRPSDTIALRDEWKDEFKELLSRRERPTAFVCVNDVWAMMAYRPIRELNLSIPGDISLVSFGNNLWSEHLIPALTTSVERSREIAETAMAILLRRLEDPTVPPMQESVGQDIRLRESTAPPPGNVSPARAGGKRVARSG